MSDVFSFPRCIITMVRNHSFLLGRVKKVVLQRFSFFMNSSSKGHSLFTVEVPAPYPRQDFLFLSFNLDILELTWNFSIYTAQVWRQRVSLEFWRASQHQRCASLGLFQMLYWHWYLPRKLSHFVSQCRAALWSLFSRSTHLHCICCSSDRLCFPL